jgi:CBS domain-containing protein
MLVRDVMQTNVITASPQTTLPDALKLVAQRRVRHFAKAILPFIEKERGFVRSSRF